MRRALLLFCLESMAYLGVCTVFPNVDTGRPLMVAYGLSFIFAGLVHSMPGRNM